MAQFRMTAFFGGLVLLALSGCQGSASGPGPATNPRDVDLTPMTTADKGVTPITKPPAKGIDAATVAAYEKEGATYGGWVTERQELPGFPDVTFFHDVTFFQPGHEAAEKGLPGFSFNWAVAHSKLPDATVPFGLETNNSSHVNDYYVLTFLVDVKHLTTLNLYGAKVTDAGMKGLAGLKNLTTLNLQQTLVTDEGLKHLAGLHNLSTLYLTRVTGTGLKDLVGLKKLTSLNINGGVTDAGIKEIVGLKNLTSLSIYTVPGLVTEAGLRELTALENLTLLELTGPEVTDAMLKELAGFKNLKELWVQLTPVTNAGVKHLAGLNNLTWINLQGTKVTREGLAELQLALPNCKIIANDDMRLPH